jgi:N-acetylmuramic acid 6-phosphate (MurNAc-6-P) etherase
LKNDSKEKLLKAEILNLNKCISRKKEKCADLSAQNEKLKKESDRISNEASEIKKENENLRLSARREEDKLKRAFAHQQKGQFETINKLQNDNQELQKQLKGGNLGIF